MHTPTPEQFLLAIQKRDTDGPAVTIRMQPTIAWAVMASIQLAARHPKFHGLTRTIATQVARELQRQLTTNSPILEQAAELGWRNDCDKNARTGDQ